LTDDLPAKLKEDAIVESLFEIRFESEAAAIPELFVGKLADRWGGFSSHRLPTADIPAQIRSLDQNLRSQPSFEFRAPDEKRLVRVGPYVFSYHQLAPYPGWSEFGVELAKAVEAVYSAVPSITVKRLGLRYINALQQAKHKVYGVDQLKVKLIAGGSELRKTWNLNYQVDLGSDTRGMVRLGTPDLVQGSLPGESSIILDVDIFTIDPFKDNGPDAAKAWVVNAHTEEKKVFFSLLQENIVADLKVK
jgi:uncharacterized protein (TIGR04255 family)